MNQRLGGLTASDPPRHLCSPTTLRSLTFLCLTPSLSPLILLLYSLSSRSPPTLFPLLLALLLSVLSSLLLSVPAHLHPLSLSLSLSLSVCLSVSHFPPPC